VAGWNAKGAFLSKVRVCIVGRILNDMICFALFISLFYLEGRRDGNNQLDGHVVASS
jgi:hypothetical protein